MNQFAENRMTRAQSRIKLAESFPVKKSVVYTGKNSPWIETPSKNGDNKEKSHDEDLEDLRPRNATPLM